MTGIMPPMLLILVFSSLTIPTFCQLCPAIASYSNSWNRGQTGTLDITFPSAVSEWQVLMVFDKPLTDFDFYQGTVTRIDSKTFLIKSKTWISLQSAGSKISCSWKALFNSMSVPPKVTSAELVGFECNSSGTSITTSSAQTQPTTSTLSTISTLNETPLPTMGINCPTAVSYGNSWNQGQDGNLDITFPSAVSDWQVTFIFDEPINQLNFYQGTVSKIDSRTFLIKSLSWNSVQASGFNIVCGWQALFDETSSPPRVVSAQLNGFGCGASLSSTSGSSTIFSTSSTSTKSTTNPTTAFSSISTSTATSTTTASQGINCPTAVSYGNSWNQGQDGNLDITFPSAVSDWQVTFIFDKPINQLNFYQGTVSKIDSRTFLIKSLSWNSVQASGSKIVCGWQALFDATSSPPWVVSAQLFGFDCGAYSSTTLESTSTASSMINTTVLSTASATIPSSTFTETMTPSTAVPVTSSTTIGSSSPSTTSTCSGISKYDYNEVIHLSNLFYQAQRSGNLDTFGDFKHDLIPYRGNSALQDGSDNGVNLSGGYYDGKIEILYLFYF